MSQRGESLQHREHWRQARITGLKHLQSRGPHVRSSTLTLIIEPSTRTPMAPMTAARNESRDQDLNVRSEIALAARRGGG